MNWAFYTFAVLWLLALGITMAWDGQPKTGKYSFFRQLIGTVINFLLLLKATNII